jgi:hypothetical protein
MKQAALLVPVVAALLAGCAHDPGPPPQVDLASAPCARSMDLARATPLLFDPKNEKSISVVLDGSSQCLEGADGARALYKLFALPKTSEPFILMVGASPWGNTLLAPRMALLDDKGAVKRSTTHADFTFRAHNLTALMRSHADETYLAVSSDTDVLGHSVSRITDSVRTNMVMAYPLFFQVYTGSDATTNYTLTPAGSLTVSLSPFPKN